MFRKLLEAKNTVDRLRETERRAFNLIMRSGATERLKPERGETDDSDPATSLPADYPQITDDRRIFALQPVGMSRLFSSR